MGSFSTAGIPLRDRHDFWRSLVARAFVELEVVPAPRVDIECRLSWNEIGAARLMFVEGTPQTVQRTPVSIASDHAEQIILMFQKRGFGSLLHQGKSVQLAPGDMVAMDTRSPYRLTFFTPFGQEVLRFPARVLGPTPYDTAALTATRIAPSFASRVLGESFSAARCGRFSLSASLETPLLQLATLAVCTPMVPHARRLGADVLGMARAYIRAHVGSPELNPQFVAMQLGMSVRSLQKLFAAVGDNPSEFILNERLARACQELRSPAAQSLTVWEVGQRCGFKDASHFSRAFRRRYGMTPGEWKAASVRSEGG